MRECRTYGSVRGARSDARPYRDLDGPYPYPAVVCLIEYHPRACAARSRDVVSLTVRDPISDSLRLKISTRNKHLGSKLATGLLISCDRCRSQALRLWLGYPCKVNSARSGKPTLSLILWYDSQTRGIVFAFYRAIKW